MGNSDTGHDRHFSKVLGTVSHQHD